MAKRGAPKGNQNGKLPTGQRGRIGWTLGLSGDELMEALTRLDAQNLDDIEARKVLREKSEELLRQWLQREG